MKIRICCHPNCEAEVKSPHVMCVYHWRALPARVQAEVQQRIRAWRDDGAAREFIGGYLRASQRMERHAS